MTPATRYSPRMLFLCSKLFWSLAAPGHLLIVGLVLGLFLRRRAPRTGRSLLVFSTLSLLFIASFPVGEWAAYPLEERFPPPATLPQKVDGIVVLGGALNPVVSTSRNRPTLTSGAERLTSVVYLARRYPQARILFTGGSGSVAHQALKEAPWAGRFFEESGVDARRVLLEAASRNTFENALFTQRLVKPKGAEEWLLVTSAMHMPRAIGCFRRVDWNVIPYPVDFHTTTSVPLWRGLDLASQLELLTVASREWTGLVAYYVMGRTSALFPGP